MSSNDIFTIFSFFTIVNIVSPVTCLHSSSSYNFQILEVVYTFNAKANAEAHVEAEVEAKVEAEDKGEAMAEAGGCG